MKQRILTAVIGISLLLVVLFFYQTWVFSAALALVAAVAVFEVLQAAKLTRYRLLTTACLLFSALVPFFRTPGFNLLGQIAVLLFLLALFAILLYRHETLRYEQIGVAFAASVLIPFSFSTMIYIRDRFAHPDGLFFILLVFAGAWFTDSGGYFIGRFFGKHKLAPKISPHKTVEGAVGGVVFCVGFYLLMGICYYFYRQHFGPAVTIHYLQLGILALVIAPISMLGDLAASMIKRQCGIKDFGSVFPGHGGVMDRFDSILFVSPALYVALQFMTLVS